MQIVWFTDSEEVKMVLEPLLKNITHATILFSHQLQINTDVYIDACMQESFQPFASENKVPILKNAVYSLAQNTNVIRCNFWPRFFNGNNKLEVAHSNSTYVNAVFANLPWQVLQVPNITGFLSARVVAMIVNEAFFALESGVSTKKDIDVAMRLGTNYPFGPFEWANKIGYKAIASLLHQLAAENSKYTPATSLATFL